MKKVSVGIGILLVLVAAFQLLGMVDYLWRNKGISSGLLVWGGFWPGIAAIWLWTGPLGENWDRFQRTTMLVLLASSIIIWLTMFPSFYEAGNKVNVIPTLAVLVVWCGSLIVCEKWRFERNGVSGFPRS